MLTISIVALLGLGVFLALKFRALPLGTGTLAFLFGISLAPTPAGTAVTDGMAALADKLANLS